MEIAESGCDIEIHPNVRFTDLWESFTYVYTYRSYMVGNYGAPSYFAS